MPDAPHLKAPMFVPAGDITFITRARRFSLRDKLQFAGGCGAEGCEREATGVAWAARSVDDGFVRGQVPTCRFHSDAIAELPVDPPSDTTVSIHRPER